MQQVFSIVKTSIALLYIYIYIYINLTFSLNSIPSAIVLLTVTSFNFLQLKNISLPTTYIDFGI